VRVERCKVHRYGSLVAHAPDRLHEEISADCIYMIYAKASRKIEARRKACIQEMAAQIPSHRRSLDEAGDRLLTFTPFPRSQWKAPRTTNTIERLHGEIKRRLEIQIVVPSAEIGHVLLGAVGLWINREAKNRRLATPLGKALRYDH
jgi:transposase-like protein